MSSTLKQSSGAGGGRSAHRTYATGDRCTKYRIVGLIDEGGMGEVYDARDEYLNRRVALKVVRVQHQGERSFAAGNQKEAQVLAELDHPNIVRLYDAGVTDEGVVFLVMERIDGRSLRFLLHWMRVFDVRSVLSIAAQIADALRVAHKSGIVHRDLKPENVIVRPSGQLKVVDFGIAKRVAAADRAASTDPFAEILTAHYASPEQALGHGAGKASDVYALGTIVYEMTTGKHPFAPDKGEMPTRQEVLLNHILATPRRLSDLAAARDAPGLSDLVAAMLAKAPGERPTAQQAYDALTAELVRYEAANPHAPGRLVLGAERRGEEEEEAPVVEDEREPAESGGRGRAGRSGSGPSAPRASVPSAVSAEVLRYVTAPLPEGFQGPAAPLPFAAAPDAPEGRALGHGATAPAPRWLRTERMAPVQPTGAAVPERPATMAVHGTAPWPAPALAAAPAAAATPAAEASARGAPPALDAQAGGALPGPGALAAGTLPVPAARGAPGAGSAAAQEGAGTQVQPAGAAVAGRAAATHEESPVDHAGRGTLALRVATLAAILAAVAGVSFAIGRYPASLLEGAEAPLVAPSTPAAVTGASGVEAAPAPPPSAASPVSPPARALSSASPSPSVPAAPQATAEHAAPELDGALPRSAPDLSSPAAPAGAASAPRERRAPRRAGRAVDDPGFYERVVEEEVYEPLPAKGPLPAGRPVAAAVGRPPARTAPRRAPGAAPVRPLH
ncbi:serine/threonine-protein kinase [Sorangium sp. So ce429]